MSIYLRMDIQKETVVLGIIGRLVAGAGTESLPRYIEELLDCGYGRIALDLTHVNDIDDTGRSALVLSYVTAMDAGGEVQFTGVSERLREMIRYDSMIERFATGAAR